MSPKNLEISVVVPAYNEEKRIAVSLPVIWNALAARFSRFEILVVDDGSSDRTSEKVMEFGDSGHPEVRVIRYGANRGKGYAVRTGMLAAQGEIVLFSDADLSTPMEELDKLKKVLDEGYDLAIGSRALKESQIELRQPFYRVLMGKTFNKIVQLMALPGVWDSQCGFKIFKRAAAKELFGSSRIDGFSFDVEILFLARKRGMVFREVPVRWINSPESKVNPIGHSLQMIKEIFVIRWLYIFEKYEFRQTFQIGKESHTLVELTRQRNI
ncbi:dolichyl-phosphate beta-glucosyltransferase [Desulfuromonas sp. CSMB_57]|uniref:dolichyl-phosphate beta-glucosyltransferase n=1 Tax=Desulfuromonas sp. CSMB_57 TaxID=2807629 RepID=UPI001CD55CA4|nr:dolichyl-phosphate beta-glucosyltransferase [Desulfuromonas sp. CSMB_57]